MCNERQCRRELPIWSVCSAHFGYMYKNEAWRDQRAHYIVNFSRAQSITVITSLHYCRSRRIVSSDLFVALYFINACSLKPLRIE
jgi:hypothetical protein